MSSPPPRRLAIETSKRKFHELLDNLTAARSTTSLAGSLKSLPPSTASLVASDETQPPHKRSRLSGSSGMNDASIRPEPSRNVSGDRIRALQEKLFSTPRKSLENQRATGARIVGGEHVRTATPPGKVTPAPSSVPKPLPNYTPYSQEAFLARLKTFDNHLNWGINFDPPIDKVSWAKRGWVLVGYNKVACKGGCEARILVSMRPPEKDENGKEIEDTEDYDQPMFEGIVEKLEDQIVNGHEPWCLWRKGGCKDNIRHLPIAKRSWSEPELIKRYQSLKAIEEHLLSEECFKYPGPPASELVEHIPPGFLDDSGPPSLIPFIFAVFGWYGKVEENTPMLECIHCFGDVGLWMFKIERLKEQAKTLQAPLTLKDILCDLEEQHWHDCPWRDGKSQANPPDGALAGLNGWETQEYMIKAMWNPNKKPQTIGGAAVGLEEGEGARSSLDALSTWSSNVDQESAFSETRSLTEKWRKLKNKLRKSTSRKSVPAPASSTTLGSKASGSGSGSGSRDGETGAKRNSAAQ